MTALDLPPDPDTMPLPGVPGLPPLPPDPDAAPGKGAAKRPTTRAGRRAAAAAKAAQPKKDSAPKGGKATPRRASLETRIGNQIEALGVMVLAAGTMTSPAVAADGRAIIVHGPGIASALDKVAKDDPRVAQALERMMTVSVWGGLFAAMLPLGVAIAHNHGALPAEVVELMGKLAPEAEAGGA